MSTYIPRHALPEHVVCCSYCGQRCTPHVFRCPTIYAPRRVR